MRARPQVCQALLFALALQTNVCYGIKWLALSKTPAALALNQTQHCKQLEGLVSAQVQLCRSNLELMHTIVHAAREVMKACRRAFADMRWNCSSIELAPNYLLDLERGTRESAFVYALSAAAISHAIARACTSGDLPGCSCGPVPGEPPGPGNRWGGCADNLSYGLLMGAKFSDAPMKVKKTGSQANKLMRLHNSEVGRQLLGACLAPPPPGGTPGFGLENVGGAEGALSWESGALNSLCDIGRVTSSLASVVPIYKMGWVGAVWSPLVTFLRLFLWGSGPRPVWKEAWRGLRSTRPLLKGRLLGSNGDSLPAPKPTPTS
ncbi:protein Wnt-11 isoform X3 [Orcinus orca]|uniref:protein Wnt-11 isoform X3 n=1 Tax=Orcinus orca TaxID=9733 RepID=UPI001441EC60|nr:protein Wnt-11 isoform X3 [Orcinus orca]